MHSFWTGYFTSRPTLKRFERIGNHHLQVCLCEGVCCQISTKIKNQNERVSFQFDNFFQVCKQLTALAKTKSSDFDANLDSLREVMGVMQHHDAVTGTEKQHVANDYARLLQIGIDKCSENIKDSLNQLSTDSENDRASRDSAFDPNFVFDYANCADLNISSCSVSENSDKFMVTLYNPLAHSTFQYVRIPVTAGDYEILDYRNVPVSSQLVSIPSEIKSLAFRRSTAEMELVFLANELPPLGFKSYFIQRKSAQSEMVEEVAPSVVLVAKRGLKDDNASFTIGNQYLNLTFDKNGLLESAASEGQVEMKVRQNFYLYEGFIGNNLEFKNRSSGAYIFRPKTTNALNIVDQAKVNVIRGDLVDEVHQVYFNEFAV